jgi:chromosome segregation ATPase
MSEAQRQSIIKVQNEYQFTERKYWRMGSPFSTKSDYTHTPEGTLTYRVYGVSEDDTRKMAEGVIEWLDNQALKELEDVQKKLEKNRAVKIKTQGEIPKLEVECQRLQKQLDEKEKEYKEANYIDWEMSDHAEKSIEELAHNLRTTDFELTGLQARIDLIGKYKAGGNISDQATIVKLNQMLIADEIERAGVLARRNAYEAALKLAKEYRDVVRAFRSASVQKDGRERDLKDAEQEVKRWENILANPFPYMRPVQVYENKVIIHPVRTDDERNTR